MHILKAGILGFALLAVAACSDSDNQNAAMPPANPEPPSTQSFNALVIDLVQNQTDDSSEPVPLNDLNLTFENDQENAFDELF